MEEKLQFIQYQLWGVIFLFFLFIGTNLYCYFISKSKKGDEPDFSEMWDKDKIDELLLKSRDYLDKYPNHALALYFRSKALVAKKEGLSEATANLLKLLESEPSLRSSIQEIINEIDLLENR